MMKRFLTIFASIAILSMAAFVPPAGAQSMSSNYQKLPASGTTLKKKSGYVLECYYSGLGQVCDYVYASVKTSAGKTKFQRLKANDDSKLKKKSGYWVECRYSGLGEVCEYVYANARAPKASSPAAGSKLQRIKADTSTLKKKGGYVLECYYSGLGQVCEYVYANVKTPGGGMKLQRLKARDGSIFKKKSGYVVECYYSGLGQVCEYVYAKPKS